MCTYNIKYNLDWNYVQENHYVKGGTITNIYSTHILKRPKGRTIVLQRIKLENWLFFGWSSKQSRYCPHSYSTPLVLPVDHTMQSAQVESLASRRSWVDRSGCLCLAQKLAAQQLLVFREWYVQECTAVTANMMVYWQYRDSWLISSKQCISMYHSLSTQLALLDFP